MTILVTGARGMIGSRLVRALLEKGHTVVGIDRSKDSFAADGYTHREADLADRETLRRIVEEYGVDRVIHLAALAHTEGVEDLSWERYRRVNVEGSESVFAAAGDRPVLFISTVDVYGFYDGKAPVNGDSPIRPVSKYGKSKALAEEACRKLSRYSIFRFSPVYTDTVKRDIQKRYYLRYPSVAYLVGKGTEFEILNVERAVEAMLAWCGSEPEGETRIIKDPERMDTADYIRAEREAGRAGLVLHFPRWMVRAGYAVLFRLLGENEKTYLLNKAVYPLRSE